MKTFGNLSLLCLALLFSSCFNQEPVDEEKLKEEIKAELKEELFDDILEALLGYIPEEVDPEIVGDWNLVSGELTNCGEESGPIDLTFTLEITFDEEGGFYFFQTNTEGEEVETFEDEGLYMASESKLILFGSETDPDLIDYEIDNDVMSLYISGDTECIQVMNFERVVVS